MTFRIILILLRIKGNEDGVICSRIAILRINRKQEHLDLVMSFAGFCYERIVANPLALVNSHATRFHTVSCFCRIKSAWMVIDFIQHAETDLVGRD